MSESSDSGKRNFFVPPNFYKPLQDRTTSQGECLVLECRLKGVPPPAVVWKREGYKIEDSPDFRMLQKGEVATLIVGEPFPEDSGVFTCEATNKAGSTSTSCKVVVKDGGYHTVSTKSAATGQVYQHPRPVQVLPTQPQAISCAVTSSQTSLNHSLNTQTHISHVQFTPKNPKLDPKNRNKFSNVNGSVNEAAKLRNGDPYQSASTNHTSSKPVSGNQDSLHQTSPSKNMATTFNTTSLYNNEEEEENFKVEKDQLIQAVAQSFNSPKPNKPKGGYNISRELAKIERDIELRQGLQPSHTLDAKWDDQEYKVSTFEQRLMNEIEYRLEHTPPVNEDPQDAVFETVPESEQEPSKFVTKLKNFKALDGTSARFKCRITGKPSPKIFWFKDGKQISKRSQHYLHKSDGEGVHELYIPQLHMDDDGNYTALASNPQGRSSSTGRLAVVSDKQTAASHGASAPQMVARQNLTNPRMMSPHSLPASVTSPQAPAVMSSPLTSAAKPTSCKLPEKGQLADDEECPVDKYYRPTFIQKPQENVKAEEGKLVRLDVKVTGLPTPNIEWLINGRPVRQDALHKILVRENNVHSLLLERASPMDEGHYTIKATNKAGTAEAQVQLHVSAREHTTAPAFIQRLAGQCVAEGEPVRLEARVVAAPRATITWKRDSDQVMPDGRVQLYQDDSGYVCLQITQARLSDAAWYTCSATNKSGISSCNCKLDVYSPSSTVTTNRRRIRTPHRYANLAKVAGVDMREALSPDAQPHHHLPESDDL